MPQFSGFEHVVREMEPLAPHTWLRLGGAAEFFAEPTTPDELIRLVTRCRDEEIPVRVLGSGANLIVREQGAPGLVLQLSAPAFGDIKVVGDVATAGGGARLGHLVSSAIREGLAGLEMLAGIPGTVGGALHGNAGGHGGDIGQTVCSATVLTRNGEVIIRGQSELQFGYRQSSLDELAILEASFRLESEDPQELTRRMQRNWIVAKASQPQSGQPCGAIFKDPGGLTAANLIEQAGLKGARIGEVQLSDRNSNFVITAPGATSSDVLRLIELVRSRVQQRFGVELERQIEVW